MRLPRLCLLALVVAFVAPACGSTRAPFTDTSATDPGGLGGDGGAFGDGKGCHADSLVCVGNDVHACSADGTAGAFVKSCDDSGDFCVAGACKAGCEAAETQPSNVGCEFWAVDLDQDYNTFFDASAAPWGVVLSNFGGASAQVVIEVNDAPPGAPPKLVTVKTLTMAPSSIEQVTLPKRWIDGSTQADDGPGTTFTSNAFRIRSDQPIVVYQLNTLENSYSNDASLLVPKNGLGTIHRVLGWPTANPIAPGLMIAGVPDHSYVTIIGTAPDTKVTVTVGGPTLGGGNVPPLAKGATLEWTVGPFDVLNLESTGIPGDMSGTIVESSAPVVVFTGGERGTAPMDATGMPQPPGYDASKQCCTDHFEEQILPVTSYGRSFVVTRSPIRSVGGYVEPDMLRFMGVAATTTVKTSLPPPNDSFTLAPGEIRDAWTTTDFVLEATEPLAVAQMLVSQTFTNPAGRYLGDPELTIFPPVEQYRRDYLFGVPTSWNANYVVIAAPVGATIKVDGAAPAGCIVSPAGTVSGKTFESRRCPIGEGQHRMNGDTPFGIVVYGYGYAGSYGFVGGANVRKIYEPPPLR